MTINETAAFFREHDRFVILTHRRPDGDTVGSASALCLGLRQLGKTAHILTDPKTPSRFLPYLDGLLCDSAEPEDTVVSTDIASESLLSPEAEGLKDRIAFAVDHHLLNTLNAPKLVGAENAACGEIIYRLLLELGAEITPRIADCLYVAISTDTGCFQYRNTTAETFETAAALVRAGANFADINHSFFESKSLGRLHLEARLTQTAELFADGTVCICKLPQSWLDEFQVDEGDLDAISGFTRQIEGVELGITIREMEDGSKLSVRAGKKFNACHICEQFGGGGHAGAAGASFNCDIHETRDRVVAVLRKLEIVKD